MKEIETVILVDDPPATPGGIAGRYVVSGDSPEELAQAAFTAIADDIGDEGAREVLAALLKRPKGRPGRAFYKDARLLPALRKVAHEHPDWSDTQVVTKVVGDAWARDKANHRVLGASESAAIVRLVKYWKLMLKEGMSRHSED